MLPPNKNSADAVAAEANSSDTVLGVYLGGGSKRGKETEDQWMVQTTNAICGENRGLYWSAMMSTIGRNIINSLDPFQWV